MPDAQCVEKLALGIREEDEAGLQMIAQPPGRFGRIGADRVQLNTSSRDFVVVAFELNQLGAAEGSPIAAVEYIECGLPGRSGVDPEKGPILVGQRIAGKRIA